MKSLDVKVQFALGMFRLLTEALGQHSRKHNCMPRRFVMHPAVFIDLQRELEEKKYSEYLKHDGRQYRFMSVPIELNKAADRAKLIDANNVVVYL